MVEFNLLLKVFLVLYRGRSLAQVCLNELNLSFLRQHSFRVPGELLETVDPRKWRTILDYTRDSDHFSLCATLMSDGIFLALLLLGFFPWLERRIQAWEWGFTLSGLAFFGVLATMANLLRIPFSLYETFVIEDRYGFNTLTARTWVVDLLKSLALFTLLGGFLLWLLLSVIVYGGRMWWVWAWLLAGGFELLLLWLFPVVMAPLFNMFEPIGDDALENHVRSLMDSAGLQVRGVFKMAADNLENVTPHPLYAWFYFSHPPLTERIRRLERRP
jgi:STE24 endopeptidase